MAELEFEVEDARDQEWVYSRRMHPLEEAAHHLGDISGWRPRMDEGTPVEHADIAGAKAPSIGNEATHHHAVNAQQILQ